MTESGVAVGGHGAGGGGSALSGNTGNSYGGNVENSGSVIINGYKSSEFPFILGFHDSGLTAALFLADQAGNGGVAISGEAIGGNAWKRGNPFTFGKGGNAQSGNSGNVDGGNVINAGGKVINKPFASEFLSLSLLIRSESDHDIRPGWAGRLDSFRCCGRW